jgi:hypothetical protein
MLKVFEILVDFIRGLASVVVRATFETVCGLLVGSFLIFFLLPMPCFMIGILAQAVLDHYQIVSVNGIGVAYFFVSIVISAVLIFTMFAANLIIKDKEAERDPALAGNGFDMLFIMYGTFMAFTILEIWAYYKYDGMIFSDTNDIPFWSIALYVVDLIIRGFIQDIMGKLMELAGLTGVGPTLTASAGMYRVEIVLKILMAATIVAGLKRYRDVTKGKGGMFLP